jgi:sec-independent protein translocase protein TatC
MASESRERVMAFTAHLDELRVRLMRALAFFLAFFLGIFFTCSGRLLAFLRAPLFQVMPEGEGKLYYTHLFENFLMHLKVSAYGSFVLLLPYFFYEAWAFVSPGLESREKRWILPLLAVMSFFFLGGCFLCYGLLFPVGFKYFLQFGDGSEVPLLTMDAYYSTVLKLLTLFGMAFQFPVFVMVLGLTGVIRASTLKEHRRAVIIGITVLSALFAPPDALSMVILGGPLILLFEACIFVLSRLRPEKKEDHSLIGASR